MHPDKDVDVCVYTVVCLEVCACVGVWIATVEFDAFIAILHLSSAGKCVHKRQTLSLLSTVFCQVLWSLWHADGKLQNLSQVFFSTSSNSAVAWGVIILKLYKCCSPSLLPEETRNTPVTICARDMGAFQLQTAVCFLCHCSFRLKMNLQHGERRNKLHGKLSLCVNSFSAVPALLFLSLWMCSSFFSFFY